MGTPLHAPNRRGLFALATLTALAAPTAAMPAVVSPDADLVRDCDEAIRLWDESEAQAERPDWTDAQTERAGIAIAALIAAATAAPALSPAGLAAKARLARHQAQQFFGAEPDQGERLILSLFRDLGA